MYQLQYNGVNAIDPTEVLQLTVSLPAPPPEYTLANGFAYREYFLNSPQYYAGGYFDFFFHDDGTMEWHTSYGAFPDFIFTGGKVPFTGPNNAAVFVPGQYFENETGYNDGTSGYLTITDETSQATPEPASLVFLMTGLLGAAGAVRRKLG